MNNLCKNKSNPPKDGLLLWYSFDERIGTKIIDRIGNNHGNIVGNDYKWINGKNSGIYFNGKDAYIEIPDSLSLQVEANNQLTVMAWVNLQYFVVPLIENFIVRKSTVWYNGWGLSWDKGVDQIKLRIWFIDGTQVYFGFPRPNGWVFVAGTYDGSSAKIYKDGELYDSRILNKVIASTETYPVYISKLDRRIKGLIGSVRIYNRALTEQEIQELYLNPDAKVAMENCVLWLPFDERKGNIVYDKSGYGNNATLYNVKWINGVKT